jgi:sec-independent protein translocase protein TatC
VSPEAPKRATTPEGEGYDDPPMTIWEHLGELRRRLLVAVVALIVCSAVAWEFREELLGFMVLPYANAWRGAKLPGEVTLHFPTPAAAFLAYFKLSLLGGAALAAPVIFYELWAFVAPGLYAREKRFVIPFVLFSTILFVGGGYFGWRIAFPLAFEYLLSLAGTVAGEVRVVPTVMMSEYIDFVTQLLLAFGAIFEMPLFILFLSMAGVISYLHLVHYGRWCIVGIFVVAAILTPPDVTSQVLMAGPMLLLYALSIGLAFLFGKPPTDAQRERMSRKKRKPEPGAATAE